MKIWLGALPWLFLYFCVQCSGQVCHYGCALNFTVCSNVDYEIYAPNVTAAIANEVLAANTSQIISLLPIPQTCRDALSLLMCQILHPKCSKPPFGEPFPLLPCVQMCLNFQEACTRQMELLVKFAPPELKPYTDCSQPVYSSDPSLCASLTNTKPLCNTSAPNLRYSGACQRFDPALAPYSGDLCAPFVSKHIFVSENTSTMQTTMDHFAKELASEIRLIMPVAPISCTKHLLSTLCPLIYPPCVTVNASGHDRQIAVGHKTCKSSCISAVTEVCGKFFLESNLTSEIPGCDELGYPDTEFYEVAGAAEVTMRCRSALFPPDPYALYARPSVPCPTQFGRKTNPAEHDPPCGLHCPDSSYSKEEWRDIVVMTQIGSSISLCCMAFLFASYMVKHEKRRFPAAMHLSEFAATSLFSISFLIGGSHPERDVWCYDEGTYATQSNNYACAIQGFFFIYFGIALTAWCAVIAFIVFYAVVVNRTKDALYKLIEFKKYFYIFGWIVPLIFPIFALAFGEIGYGPPLAWCFIHFEGFGHGSGFSADYPLFYIPIGVLFVAIIVMFFTTVGTILHVHQKGIAQTNKSHVVLNAQMRVLIFIFVVFVMFFTIFQWRFQIEARNSDKDIQVVGLQWAYCKMKTALELNNTGFCPGEKNPARVNYPHTVFESLLLSGIGILIFVAFGSDISIYSHWALICSLAWARDWAQLKRLVLRGTEPTTPPISGGSGSARSGGGVMKPPAVTKLNSRVNLVSPAQAQQIELDDVKVTE